MQSEHVPVMRDEILRLLSIQRGDVVCDATAGGGGHLAAICRQFGSTVSLVGIDTDPDALERAHPAVEAAGCSATFLHGNFREISALLRQNGIEHADRILFDLGMSSDQLVEAHRGFSFREENEPLDMRFDPRRELPSAYEVVNTWGEQTLTTIIRGYGEERHAKAIARGIVRARETNEIKTTGDLVEIILANTPTRYHHGRLHPATRAFQAIRIAVNDELSALKDGLSEAFEVLAEDGRIAVISFHSLEDRIVKQTFRHWADQEMGRRVTKKPMRPSDEEREVNPRSRSARLRVFKKQYEQ
jgi:16S rRNA (cytosine1402-N4)-methyltransferase